MQARQIWEFIKKDYTTNIAIALFTFVLAVVSIFQGCITRGQLTQMQAAQRPFVFTEPQPGNQWLNDSEHDMAITILMRDVSAFPAINVVSSHPKIWMGTTAGAADVIKHCDVDYPANPGTSVIPPWTANMARPDALSTVRTDYIPDKQRIQNGTDSVVIYGGIKYSGITGGEFETKYCYAYLPLGDYRFGSCACTSNK